MYFTTIYFQRFMIRIYTIIKSLMFHASLFWVFKRILMETWFLVIFIILIRETRVSILYHVIGMCDLIVLLLSLSKQYVTDALFFLLLSNWLYAFTFIWLYVLFYLIALIALSVATDKESRFQTRQKEQTVTCSAGADPRGQQACVI